MLRRHVAPNGATGRIQITFRQALPGWSGCPIGGMGITVSETGSGCAVATTAVLIRLERLPAVFWFAKHQDKSGSCPSLNDVCLRALTTKPKKLAA
jgi:hypothetical protein